MGRSKIEATKTHIRPPVRPGPRVHPPSHEPEGKPPLCPGRRRKQAGGARALRAALDSSPLWGRAGWRTALSRGLASPQHRRPVRQGPVHPRLRRRATDLPGRGCCVLRARQDRALPERAPAPPARCTTSSNGRSVSIHPDEALLAELRRRQQTPQGRAKLRERTQVEHARCQICTSSIKPSCILRGQVYWRISW
jgi:hypothetical protein